jgi:hypothetical protein
LTSLKTRKIPLGLLVDGWAGLQRLGVQSFALHEDGKDHVRAKAEGRRDQDAEESLDARGRRAGSRPQPVSAGGAAPATVRP